MYFMIVAYSITERNIKLLNQKKYCESLILFKINIFNSPEYQLKLFLELFQSKCFSNWILGGFCIKIYNDLIYDSNLSKL